MEKWKDIVGFEGLYEISNHGRIKSSGEFIDGWVDGGYRRVSLCKCGKETVYKVHRLVGLHFIPNPESKPFINHKNCIGTDNRVENLEWCTASENIQHAYDNNRINRASGLNSHIAKIMLHPEIGVFATVSEVAKMENRSFGQMAAIVRGEYPNKTKWILV
jgi:hypothetical protein